jgi:hypothetical protein
MYASVLMLALHRWRRRLHMHDYYVPAATAMIMG